MRNPIGKLVLTVPIALAMSLSAWSQQFKDPVAILQSDASLTSKQAACIELSKQGGKEAIPVLQSLLTDEKLSHMARYALEPMPHQEASKALRDALGETSGSLQVGIIHSLSVRHDEKAVPALIDLLSKDDPQVVRASARALGTIATKRSGEALLEAIAAQDIDPPRLQALCDGLFRYAEANTKAGKQDKAAEVYGILLDVANAPDPVRAASLRGAVLAGGTRTGLPLLKDALKGKNEALFEAGLRVSRELEKDENVTSILASVLDNLPDERTVLLLEVLGQRGEAAAGPAVLSQAKKGTTEVRLAAIRALARMGYRPSLDLLAKLAWTEEGDVAKAAREALSYFPKEDGDEALRALLKNKKAEARMVAVELIGQGGLESPAGILMETVRSDGDEGVRIAALKGLYHHAGMSELSPLLGHLQEAQSAEEIRASEKALGALCARQKKMATGNVVIQKALYGVIPDGPLADVTQKVADMVKSGVFAVEATNGTFGDPSPGIRKQLQVDYTESGVSTSKTVQENESLKLTTVAAPPPVAEAFCSAFEEAKEKDTPATAALVRLMGTTGNPTALRIVRDVSAQPEGELRDSALRALCEWPTEDALPIVMDLAQTSQDETMKMLAYRGAVRLLKQTQSGADERIEKFAILLDHASRPDERKLVLSGISPLPHPEALNMALSQLGEESVRAEATQAAVAIAKILNRPPREESGLCNGEDLQGWSATTDYWTFEDGAIVGRSETPIPDTAYLWSDVKVADFYFAVDVKLEPPAANSGIQFRSEKINEAGQALGHQGDMGQGVWGRLYHQGGRGKLDWNGRAEEAVKPGDWNRYEILAIGPAIWTAVNGKLGVACLDVDEKAARSGMIAFQIHQGAPQTVRYKGLKLVHNPKIELAGMKAEALIPELKVP